MKEEALKLAVWLENMSKLGWADNFGQELDEISAMIRRLVEELDKPHKYDPETGEPLIDGWPLFSGLPRGKPLSDEENKKATSSVNDIASDADKSLLNSKEIIAQTKLSENEIRHIYQDYWLEEHGQIVDFVRAIEERHGIK